MTIKTTMIKPKKLKKGDLVGLVTTSQPVSQKVIDKSVSYLQGLGFNVRVGKHAADAVGFMGGRPEDRANDLMEMFLDDTISGIFITGGGRTANHLLPLLNFDEIRKHPKMFMALSNSSIIANAITAKSGIITFHGPTGYLFGEEGITPFTEEHMIKVIFSNEPIGTIESYSKSRLLKKGTGIVKGRLYGGHLLTNRSLLGTPYAPDWEGSILFIEECFQELHDFDDSLMHYKLSGVFEKISALIVGTPMGVEEKSYPAVENIQDIILRICKDYDFPILYGLDIGHTPNKVTLPIGAMAELDRQSGVLRINESVLR